MERLLADAEKLSGKKYNLDSFADIAEAIHVIQTEMRISGTTAAEAAETIQGSINAMKSAWQNLITGMADDDQDLGQLTENLVDSILTVADNIVPRLQELMPRLVEGLRSLVNSLLPRIPPIFETLLPPLIEAATALVTGIADILPDIITTILGAMPQLLDAALQILYAIGSGLIDALPQLLEAAVQIVEYLARAILENLPKLAERGPEILQIFGNAILAAAPTLLGIGAEILQFLADGISSGIAKITNALPEIIQAMLDYFGDNLPAILEVGTSIIKSIARGLIYGIRNIAQALPEIVQSILNFFDEHGDELLAAGADILGYIVRGILDSFPILFDALAELVLTFLGAGDEIAEGFGEKTKLLSGVLQGLAVAFAAVKAAVVGYKAAMAITEIIENVSAAISFLTNITNLQAAAQAALNFVMNMNPFVAVTTVVLGLAGAFVTLMTTSENFRNAVVSAFDAVIEKAKELWDWIGKVTGGVLGGGGESTGRSAPRMIRSRVASVEGAANDTAGNSEEGISLTASTFSRASAVRALESAMPNIEARVSMATAAMAPAAGYAVPAPYSGGGSGAGNLEQSPVIVRPNMTIQFQGDLAQLGRVLNPVIKEEDRRLGAGV